MKSKMINQNCWTGIIFFIFILILFTNAYSQNIHGAVYEGNIETVKSLLQKNPILVNEKNNQGRTPLFMAILQRNQDMVKLLIDKGALVRIGDSNLRAPIHFAGFMNDTSMIALLLDNGAVIDTRAIGAATPLIHSSLTDRVELSRFLIRKGADINIQCNALSTPLYFAVLNNNLEYLRYLLDAGADIDTPDFLNRTPLYVAVRDGYPEIVKLLIQYGADYNFKDVYLNRSLLHLAAIQGHRNIAELLIQKGLNVNEKDLSKRTPLDYAHQYGHTSTAEVLVGNKGKTNRSIKITTEKIISDQNLKHGEAIIIKLQNGSWAVNTRKHLFILAYSETGSPPPEKSIVNGYLTGDEMTEIPWFYFDLNFHPQQSSFALQGNNPLYSMQKKIKHLSYILNSAFENNYSQFNLDHSFFPKPEQTVNINDLKITVVPSYGNKKGYFIECEGLSLFWLSGLCDNYISTKKDTKAIEYVKEHFSNIDLLFLGTPDGLGPEEGNGIREAYLESMCLNPNTVFFMGKEPLERKILNQIKRRVKRPDNIHCSENPGDRFFYSQGKIK